MRRSGIRLALSLFVPLAVAAHANGAGSAALPHPVVLAPPSNDECSGAIVVPPLTDGNTAFLTTPVDIDQATPRDVNEGLHACADGGADRTIWYRFTPSITGRYVISTCAATAVGNTVYDTAISLFESTGGSCPQAAPVACDDSFPCEATVPGAPYEDQGTISTNLLAGQTYFVVAGHWALDLGGAGGINKTMVVSFQYLPKPRNDDCRVTEGGYAAGGTGPAPLALDRITTGTTALGTDDYRSAGCTFLPPGEFPTVAPGRDVVFSFAPPDDGSYSFRYVQDDNHSVLRSQSPVLYLSTQCPDPNTAAGVPSCLAAANRMNDQTTGNDNRSEELDCVALTGGQTYYLYFDDAFAGNEGGDVAVEVTRCHRELEPNGDPSGATTWSPGPMCFMEGGANPSGTSASEGDADFFALGAPPAGSKLFAAVDAAAASNSDFEMRFTSTTDTLAYDDNDGTSILGSNAPVLSGPIAPGGSVYARINGKPAVDGLGPYRLYYRAETGPAQLEPDPDPSADENYVLDYVHRATHVTGGGFVGGTIFAWSFTTADVDCWRFVAHEGDQLLVFTDGDPDRSPGSITNLWPVLLTATGGLPAAQIFSGQVVRNSHPNTPQPGTLEGTEASGAPSVTSEFFQYQARYTGWYSFCLTPAADIGGVDNPPPSAYPRPYRASLSINCGPIPPPQPADLSVTQAGLGGTIDAGDIVEYTITVTNNDASAIAQDARIVDLVPSQLVVLAVEIDDGFPANDTFGSGNTGCINLPTPGENDAPIDCTTYSIAPGATVIYTITAQVRNCLAPGQSAHNDVALSSFTQDPETANNTSTASFTIGYTGSCTPLICSPSTGCIVDTCHVDGTCTGIGGACETIDRNCDDADACTLESCDPRHGADPCIHDASYGAACDDGNPCTEDGCDPVSFCVFPPASAGIACDDFLGCTTDDACDGNGSCAGHSVCDDGNPCTDDFADESSACACQNVATFPGSPCEDGNACTSDTYCDGSGTAAACSGGSTIDCDDGNPCTDDACDPSTGCVHSDNTAPCGVPGSACVTGGLCGGGTCHPGGPINCDDGDCCTIDGCDPSTGCTHASNPAGPVFASQPTLGSCPLLWPPEHGYVDVTIAETGASAQSACGVTSIRWASCASSQVENAHDTGDGNTMRDCVFTDALLSMRAERDGSCSPAGRTYTARLIATDACGRATLSDPIDVGVWHDRGHPPASANVHHAAGSGTIDTRNGTNGSYPASATCGSGSACANGTPHDSSDADPEAEIRQLAALSVDSLRVDTVQGALRLSWVAPVASGQVTRYHVWRLDPATLFWTQVAELDRTAASYGIALDGLPWHYKVTAVIK